MRPEDRTAARYLWRGIQNASMKNPSYRPAFLFTLATQLVLLGIAFGRYFTRPEDFMFNHDGDGIKNYFTLRYYIQHNVPGQWSWFSGMNYPFGEYIFYTDNTPLLAVFLKLLDAAGLPVGPWSVPIFHWVLIANLLAGTLLAFRLGRRLQLHPWLNALMSLGIVWISPQLFKIFGQFNLSFSSFFLGTLLLMWRAYDRLEDPRRLWRALFWLVALLVVAAFFHLYYLPILGIMVGAFGIFLLLHRTDRAVRLRSLLIAVAPLAALVITLAVIRLVDTRYGIRPVGGGYDWEAWKSDPIDFARAYSFMQKPQLARHTTWSSEKFTFFGSAVVFGGILVLVYGLWWRERLAALVRAAAPNRTLPFVLAVFGAGIICWSTALGNVVRLLNGEITYDNWLSPFYFLQSVSSQVEQFRCLTRFSWAAYYCTWIAFFYALDRLALKNLLPRRPGLVLAGLVALLMVRDLATLVRYYGKDAYYESNFKAVQLSDLPALDYSRYQAILPLPFFHVGNETRGLILDDERETSIRSFQLSLRSGLPLVACKMSRTPPEQSLAHYSLILEGRPDSALLARFDERPLLVIEKKEYAAPEQPQTPAETVLKAGKTLVQRYAMPRVGEDALFWYYEWKLPE
jgi:hypothetical protein